MQIKDEHDDRVDEPRSLEAMPAPHQRVKCRSSGQKIKGDQLLMARLEMDSTQMPKSGKISLFDVNVVPEVKQEVFQAKYTRKKPKTLISKARLNVNSLHFSQHFVHLYSVCCLAQQV